MDVPTPRTRAGSPTHPCIHTCMPTHTRAHTHIRASKHTSPGRRRHGIAARLRHKTYRISRATPVDSRCVCSAAPAQTDAVVAPPLNVPSCCRMQPRPSHRVRRKTCTVLLTRDGVHATYDPSDASNGRYNVRLAAHQGGGERAGHRQAVPSAPGGSTRRARACWMLCAGVQGSRATRALTWLTHTCTPRTRRQFVERWSVEAGHTQTYQRASARSFERARARANPHADAGAMRTQRARACRCVRSAPSRFVGFSSATAHGRSCSFCARQTLRFPSSPCPSPV